MPARLTLNRIFAVMARASCGESEVRVDDGAGLDPDVPVDRIGIALNLLLADLEYRQAEAREALKAAGEERARRLAGAEEAVRMREQFLSLASHELYTPLTSLQLTLQGLRAGARAMTPEQIDVRLAAADRQTRKLSRLVADLLDLGEIRCGRCLALYLEDTDLAQVVREVAEELSPDAHGARCTLSVDAEGPVPGRWDRSRVEQIVRNLLTNAIKFGSGKPIELRVRASGEAALLTVRDHGLGIAPEHLPHVFEFLERAVSPRHYGGLGLGLFIVREVVRAHGGAIRVESRPGQGATFTVELPYARAPAGSSVRLDHELVRS